LDGEDMIDHGAIAQRVRPAGVGADVAADRRHSLRRGIRREEEAMRSRRGAHLEIRDAGVDDRDARDRVDRMDRPQPGGRDDHRVAAGDRAARQAGARSPWHDRDACVARGANAARDLVGVPGHGDGERRASIESRVVLEDERVLFAPEDVALAADRLEVAYKAVRGARAHAARDRARSATPRAMSAQSAAGSPCTLPWKATPQLAFAPLRTNRGLLVRAKFSGLETIIQYERSGMLLDPDRAVLGMLLLPDRHDGLQLVDGLACCLERSVAVGRTRDDDHRDLADREVAGAMVEHDPARIVFALETIHDLAHLRLGHLGVRLVLEMRHALA